MNNNILAINIPEINKLMIEIADISSNINVIFNKINELVDETKSYYTCSAGSIMRNKYAMFNDNFRIIVNNIMTYNRDLAALKKKYEQGMDNLSIQIKKDISALDTNGVEYKERR